MKEGNKVQRKYLVFYNCQQPLAMDFEDVKIILAYEPLRELPDFPDYVEGQVVNGGEIFAVINLNKRFGYSDKQPTERSCIIICRGDKKVGLLCDSVSGFVQKSDEELKPPPDVNENANARFISAQFLLEGKPCCIVKPELVIRQEDEEAFTVSEK